MNRSYYLSIQHNKFVGSLYLCPILLFLALLSNQNVFGQINRAIYLGGNGDYVEIPHSNSFNFTNNFTVAFWLRPDAIQADISANANNILIKSYNFSGGIPFAFQFINSGADIGKIKVIRKNTANAAIANYMSSSRIDDGKFHYVAFVKDSLSVPNLKLYVDGVLQGTGISDIVGTVNNNNSLYLGRNGAGENVFSGALDEIRLWKSARSAGNLLSDMSSTTASTTVGYYNMETGLKNKGSALSVNGYLGGNTTFFPTSKSYMNALHFDGNNDFVSFAANPGTFTNQMTVDAWIRPENLSSTQCIANQTGKWALKLVAGKPLFSLTTTLGNTLNISANTALSSVEKWYHVTALFNGNGSNNRIELYVNGELENSIALSTSYSIATTGTGMLIGANGTSATPQQFFKGMIDEVNLWKTALTTDNIITDMNKGDQSVNTNHLVYGMFDQGIPNSGNSSMGILNNFFANGNGSLNNFALSGNTSNWVARATYIEAPNVSTGNPYHFESNVLQTGTGQTLSNGFLWGTSAIAAYPAYNNSAVNVLQATLNTTTFEQTATLPGGSFYYNSYMISTEGLVLSGQSTGPCVTGFPVGNMSFTSGSSVLTAKWRKVTGATAYDWVLTAPNGSINTPDQSGSKTANTDTSVVLRNLDPGSRYYFYVRARCGGGVGEWVGPAFFTTTSSPVLNADSLKNDTYIDIEWSLPSAYFIQNAPSGVHLQLKNGNTILYEQPITDYSSYQGAPQPTFAFVGTGSTQQYYNISNTNTWSQLSTWTMETWVKMGASNTYSTRLFRNLTATTPISIWIDSLSKSVNFSLNNVNYTFSHSQLPVEQWFHLAVVYSGGMAILYLDGLPAATLNLPVLPISGGTYQVLYAANGVNMAELRFWNRARTAQEIAYSRLTQTFTGVAQNNLLLHWKWQTQTNAPLDLATTYDGLNNSGLLYQIGGGQLTSFNHLIYAATPYYSAIHGSYRHYTGPSATKTYKINGYQIGSGTIINAVYFPPLDTGKTLAYQPLEWVKADSTPFNVALTWKNKSKMSEFFRIRRTNSSGTNSVILATVSGTDKIDSVLTFTDTFNIADSLSLANGTVYRYYVDTYSATFNQIMDSLKYNSVNLPAINVVASDNLFPNKITLSWNNLADFGAEIRIDRDGEILTTLNADMTSYEDIYPIYGKRHRYSVMLIDPNTNNPIAAGFDRGSVQAKGQISGNVYSLVGSYALRNIRIRLTNLTTNTQDSVLTDANGAFSFNNLYYGKNGDFAISAYYPNHDFLNSPRTLSLSDQNYSLTDVIFKDSTQWTADTLNTNFTLTNFLVSPQNTQDKVNLSWNYSLQAGDTLRMNVYRDNEIIRVLNVTSGTTLLIADTTGKPGYVYDYSITAYQFQGNTVKVLSRTQSAVTFPTLALPSTFTTTISNSLGVVNLAWTHSSQNYQGFKIYRAKQTANPSPPSDTVLIATISKGTFTFKDKQTLFGTSGYQYVIRAYRTIDNLTFESGKVFSGTINYPTLPNLSVLTATATPARNSVNLTWTLPGGSPLADTSYNFDGYLIYRKKNVPANSPYELIGRTYKHFSRIFEDKTGAPATAYTYQVKAFLKNISPSTKKDTILVSTGITKTATFPIIKAPITLTLANNINYVTLNWVAPTSQSGGARNFDGQTVYFRVNGVTDSADITVSQNTYTHYTNNTSATPTTFSVRAYRKVNGIKYTSTSISNAGFATGANPSNLPLPQQFKASQNLPAHIRLSWSYPDYILADFRLYRDGSLIAVLTNEAREYYDYDAKGYQNYFYEIEASFSQTTTLRASAIGKLNSLSSVMGRVYASSLSGGSKYGLPYIEVTASATGFFARTFTDSTGFYRIDNLPTQQSLPITVTVDGGNTKFSTPNFPATQTFNTDGERYKIYSLDFKSDYSPASKDSAQISDIEFITATPDPARKQVNIAWSPSNRNYDGFYIYRANALIGTVSENEDFVFNDTEGSLGINYLYTVLPFVNGADGILTRSGKTTSATYPAVEPVIYLDANANASNNTVEVTWSHKWANHTQYQISKNGKVIAQTSVNQPTSYIDNTGIPGQLYTYEVVAIDSVNGAKTYSTPMSVQANFPILADVTDLAVSVPDTSLSCTNISRNHVYLQWTYLSEVTGFWVYRNGVLIKVLPYTQTFWQDSSGTPTLASVYKVKAYINRNGTNYSADGVEKKH